MCHEFVTDVVLVRIYSSDRYRYLDSSAHLLYMYVVVVYNFLSSTYLVRITYIPPFPYFAPKNSEGAAVASWDVAMYSLLIFGPFIG